MNAVSDALKILQTQTPRIDWLDTRAQRHTYERDGNVLLAQAPALVALPKTSQDVADVVRCCHDLGLAFTTRGAGTGLAAGSVPHDPDCVMISTARLHDLFTIDESAMTVHVGAGMVNARLNEILAPTGLMYAPDPSSQKACTLGGNWAANAGGVHCIGYGVTMDHVLSLKVITPEGNTVWISPHEQPSTFAKSWNGLYIGSEGTLGILTEAIIKLTPMPQHVGVALIGFNSVNAAMHAVGELTAAGLNPKAVEFIDAITIKCVNKSFGVGLPENAQGVLLVELAYYYEQELTISHAKLEALIDGWNPLSRAWETNAARRDLLWKARKGAVASYGQISPMFYVLDSVIPRQQLAYVLDEMQKISERFDLTIANVFHAGDGNLHPHLMFSDTLPETVHRVEAAASAIFSLCIEVGGVLSGEHGIGMEKIKHMEEQFDEASLTMQQQVKRCFDRKDLVNPGKLIPMKSCCGESHPPTKARGLSAKGLSDSDLWI